MPATALAPGGLMGAIARRVPVGVVACITPYNFPIVNMAGKVGPALAMGNTVVVKPAPQDPLAVIRFGGGCQGCGAADITLKSGIERLIKDEIPEVTEVLDATDHSSGANPYYTPGK